MSIIRLPVEGGIAPLTTGEVFLPHQQRGESGQDSSQPSVSRRQDGLEHLSHRRKQSLAQQFAQRHYAEEQFAYPKGTWAGPANKLSSSGRRQVITESEIELPR